ncbi:hypothetical protein ZIOFF_061301 [Zingiber officinale]|uniref:Formyl transferase N-terminal domain-containing protein n=1 Tax=Zingiber officinale TaxID=94328 RepID=A0A8J5KEG2_ZINOF|nr:hypothetical protein ZIOFF_061301 [Zingiber officinale]
MVLWDRIARRAATSIPGTQARSVIGIHVFRCPDVVGIVAKLSECIASRGGNIQSVDVFVPENKQVFYSRRLGFAFAPDSFASYFVGSRFDDGIVCLVMDDDFLKLSKLFKAERSIVRVPYLDPKYKIAILVSKQNYSFIQEHCLVDLLYRWQEGKLPVDISCVIRHGIPYHYLPMSEENKREPEILKLIKDTDFIILARYMQAFDAGVKLIGATTHFVTEELDAGPIIEQMVERVSHRDTLQSFVQKSENLEKQCLAQAVKSYCELRVLPYEVNKTIVF